MERIPKLIEQHKVQNTTLERDIPTLQEEVNGTWKKEEELKKLKGELSALERKIQLMLISKQEIQSNERNRKEPILTEINIDNGMNILDNKQLIRRHI